MKKKKNVLTKNYVFLTTKLLANKKINMKFLNLIASCLVLSSCSLNVTTLPETIENVISSTVSEDMSGRPMEEETYTVGTFTDIACNTGMNMKIVRSQDHKVVISSNALDKIEVTNESKALRIHYAKGSSLTNVKTNITVYTPSFEALSASSSGSIKVEDPFKLSELSLSSSSSGSINGFFDAEKINAKSSSSGSLKAHIKTKYLTAHSSSSGSINLTADQSQLIKQLDIHASSSASLALSGRSETTEAKVSSSGKITGDIITDQLNVHASSNGDFIADVMARTIRAQVSSSGLVKLKSDPKISINKVYAQASSLGDFKLSGKADKVEASASSSGTINLSQLQYNSINRSTSSGGSVVTK